MQSATATALTPSPPPGTATDAGERASAETRLEWLRWPRGVPVCPHCGSRHTYRMVCPRSGGVRFKCARCRKPFSARRGTVLERSNVDTATWLRVLDLFLAGNERGLPARIERQCGVSYKTAWSMVQRLRAAPDDPLVTALRHHHTPAALATSAHSLQQRTPS
ncbi:transposase [uncultured Rhodospira sp.]|uniref:transposase n=1 Tax=uncultured Rhodospira sp. TaxID=1936189 RepID=UPI00260800C3|nr:transposase [uncultured Rhodospira sp.]